MKIINLSSSQRCAVAEEILTAKELKNNSVRRIILLPVPSFRDGEHISGTDITADALIERTEAGDLVVGYRLPARVYSAVLARGAFALDLERDGEFIHKNNELTAHAALPYILNSGERDIADLHIGIIGYGRLGAMLARLVLFLGARITVFSGTPEKREALSREGISALGYDAIANTGVDILINTAPGRLTESIPEGVPLVDLASGNYYASLGARFLPSLPEKHYPKSAGKAYAKAVIDYYNLH